MSSNSSDESLTTPANSVIRPHTPSVFVCGFVPKRWHNGSLNNIITDLTPEYFVACNGGEFSLHNRSLLVNSECLLFFVNEYTLADRPCLLALQYAWHLMTPIVMLRPPRTKLVITAHSRIRKHIVVNINGTVVRSPSVKRELAALAEQEQHVADPTEIDYSLLQDVLYEGYRIAIVYDRLDHYKSMSHVKTRIARATRPFHLTNSSLMDGDEEELIVEQVRPSKRTDKQLSIDSSSSKYRRPATPGRYGHSPHQSVRGTRSPIPPRYRREDSEISSHGKGGDNTTTTTTATTNSSTRMRLSHSMTSLSEATRNCKKVIIPPLIKTNGIGSIPDRRGTSMKCTRSPLSPIKVERESGSGFVSSEASPSINTSLSSPFDRRMSMCSLDDTTHYTTTQYLIFPIHDPTKKPQLVRFPNDLLDESVRKSDSPWGSDSDLEEEVDIAPKINGDIGMLDESDSPIQSPAPYNLPIVD